MRQWWPWSSFSVQSPILPIFLSIPCPAFTKLQYEPLVVVSHQAEAVLTQASPSSHWLYLQIYNLSPSLGNDVLFARSQSTVSAEVTGVSTLPTYRSSTPAALGWGRKRSHGGSSQYLTGSLTGVPAAAFIASSFVAWRKAR